MSHISAHRAPAWLDSPLLKVQHVWGGFRRRIPVQRSSRVISLRRLAFLHSIAVLVRSQIEPRSDLSERVTGFVVPGDRTATAAGMCIPRSQKLRPGSEHSSASDATCSMSEKTPRFPACRPGQRLSSRQDQRVRHRWRLTRHR